jgi:competence ComEA-like helix-hairpin-helix protein
MTKQRSRRNKSIIAVIVAALGLGSAGTWLARNGSGLTGSSAPVQGTLRVNINTSTLTELESIPGIGEARAKHVVAGRPYASVDELIKVSGIGPKSLEDLRPYVKVDGETEKLR